MSYHGSAKELEISNYYIKSPRQQPETEVGILTAITGHSPTPPAEDLKCEDSRTAAKIGPAKGATWMVGKTPKEDLPKELLFIPYLVTLATQNLFGNSQLRRSDGCPFSVELRRDYP
ncbi:hypothetical protein AVEN_159249-1 [Araneus ventricosus]|uniref:Uncharacterized protein n=1 Tax=Araneus ventricosus TaxID=182803 RepID=A0A4Y2A0V0_ARAVE|nr:hypothetical protein AVEN_159249-1 [Araneus ventricosus]